MIARWRPARRDREHRRPRGARLPHRLRRIEACGDGLVRSPPSRARRRPDLHHRGDAQLRVHRLRPQRPGHVEDEGRNLDTDDGRIKPEWVAQRVVLATAWEQKEVIIAGKERLALLLRPFMPR